MRRKHYLQLEEMCRTNSIGVLLNTIEFHTYAQYSNHYNRLESELIGAIETYIVNHYPDVVIYLDDDDLEGLLLAAHCKTYGIPAVVADLALITSNLDLYGLGRKLHWLATKFEECA